MDTETLVSMIGETLQEAKRLKDEAGPETDLDLANIVEGLQAQYNAACELDTE